MRENVWGIYIFCEKNYEFCVYCYTNVNVIDRSIDVFLLSWFFSCFIFFALHNN